MISNHKFFQTDDKGNLKTVYFVNKVENDFKLVSKSFQVS